MFSVLYIGAGEKCAKLAYLLIWIKLNNCYFLNYCLVPVSFRKAHTHPKFTTRNFYTRHFRGKTPNEFLRRI